MIRVFRRQSIQINVPQYRRSATRRGRLRCAPFHSRIDLRSSSVQVPQLIEPFTAECHFLPEFYIRKKAKKRWYSTSLSNATSVPSRRHSVRFSAARLQLRSCSCPYGSRDANLLPSVHQPLGRRRQPSRLALGRATVQPPSAKHRARFPRDFSGAPPPPPIRSKAPSRGRPRPVDLGHVHA